VSKLGVSPLSGIMGAEIENVDLGAPLPDAVFAQIARAFLDHKLRVFRGQALSPGQIQAFAEHFGPIEVHTVRRPDGSALDGVDAVTNLDADGKPSLLAQRQVALPGAGASFNALSCRAATRWRRDGVCQHGNRVRGPST
jgi:alpha-ketoglutarate-dependent taurine dioxygenase